MTGANRETAEQKAVRRRWINLAELVAVCGVVIAALSLWLTWSDRRDTAADKARASAAEQRDRARLDLSATPDGDTRLKLADAKHDLTDVIITFPKVLGVAAQRPAGEPLIEAAPFAPVMLKLTDGGADDRTGRLPVLITASYVDGDATRTATGLYDIVWATHGRRFAGRALTLTGLRLRKPVGTRAGLEAAWMRERP